MSGQVLELERRAACELTSAPTLELQVEPLSLLQLVGLVQLAMRHAALPPSTRELGETIVRAASLHLRAFPALLEMIQRGNDCAFDEPASEVKRWI